MKMYQTPLVNVTPVIGAIMLMTGSPSGNIQGTPEDKGLNNPVMAPGRKLYI